MGRATKHLADLTLQAGLVTESLTLFHAASETLRAISDSLWLGAASEGLCAASAILQSPKVKESQTTTNSTTTEIVEVDSEGKKAKVIKPGHSHSSSVSSSSSISSTSSVTSSVSSSNCTTSNTNSTNSPSGIQALQQSLADRGGAATGTGITDQSTGHSGATEFPSNMLKPDAITTHFREAIINYSKYRHAGIIETEAALKAARICIEQNTKLDVAMFLQSVLYIKLNMSEAERVQRFETLTDLYQKIG